MPAAPHILIAEDEALIAELFRMILEAKGYRITLAPDGMYLRGFAHYRVVRIRAMWPLLPGEANGMIDELEQDALTELVNMGVSRAATQLSRLTDAQVSLSVPSVMIVPRGQAVELLPAAGTMPLVAVCEHFTGRFSGCALLMFPEESSLELVRAAVTHQSRQAQLGIPELREVADLEPEALSEIGNVMLNGCLTVLANGLHETLTISLPELLRGDGRALLLGAGAVAPGDLLLFVQVDFSLYRQSIRGYVVLTLDLPELEKLRGLLRDLTAEIVQASVPPACSVAEPGLL